MERRKEDDVKETGKSVSGNIKKPGRSFLGATYAYCSHTASGVTSITGPSIVRPSLFLFSQSLEDSCGTSPDHHPCQAPPSPPQRHLHLSFYYSTCNISLLHNGSQRSRAP